MEDFDVEALLRQHNISYKHSGNNVVLKCLNPSHIAQKHLTMSINLETSQFHCWSCGFKGNYFTLYKLLTGESYNQENKWYSPKFIYKEKRAVTRSIPERIIKFGKTYNPLDNTDIREWLRERGIEKDSFIEKMGIEYAPYVEYAPSSFENNPKEYTKLYSRIITPIYHERNLLNYECRTYTTGIPKVMYIKHCGMQTLYNFDNLDLNEDVIITEGIKGLWRVWNVDPNVVAMFHCIPSDEQLIMLRKIKGNLIFFLDNDESGLGKKNLVSNKIEREGTYYTLKEKLGRPFYWITARKEGNDPNDCSYKEIENLLSNRHSHIEEPCLVLKKKEVLW